MPALHDRVAVEIAPLSLERVRRCLTAHGYSFLDSPSEEGVLTAGFHDYRFQFILTGEDLQTLQVRGRWNHALDVLRKVEMVKMCNEANMNRISPKAYVRREAEDHLGLYAEYAADFHAGATDAQIDRAVTCGLKTIIAFFRDVEGRCGTELATD